MVRVQREHSPALVLTDGGPPSLVAAAIEAEASLRAGGDEGGHTTGSRLMPVPIACAQRDAAAQAAEQHERLFGIGLLPVDLELWTLAARFEHRAGLVLSTAIEVARGLGLSRVVWPALPGEKPEGEPVLAAVASIIDQTVLATRLSTAATLGEGEEIRVEAPFADLTRRQIADLVEDFALPLDACWWAQEAARETDGSRAERERWERAAARGEVRVSPVARLAGHDRDAHATAHPGPRDAPDRR